MHKSNYDKASEVAMGKLRPKPDVSITISMKGGGGLSSLGEFPIIRRFMGSYTDEMAGVEPDMYGTATPGMTYTEDDFTPPPEGPATGGLDSTDVKAYEAQFKEVAKDRNIANTLKQNVQPFKQNYMPVRTFIPPSKYNPMFNPTAGRNTLGMLTAGQTKDKFEDNEEWQLMGQSSEKQDLIKDTKEYLDQLEEVSANKFTSTWGRAKDLANNPQAASNFLSAVLNPSSNFYGIDALDIELPNSLVQEANKAREIGQRKGGGGLSSLNEMPVIRRFMGSYTDEDAGVDTGLTDEESSYQDALDYGQAQRSDPGEDIPDVAFGVDDKDRIALIDPDRPEPLAFADTDDNINYRLSQEVPLNFMEKGLRSIFQSFGGKAPFGLPEKGDTKLVSEEDYEKMYGNRAGFAAKLDNRTNQWAAGINKVKSDIDKRSEEEDPKTPEEIEKEEREGLLEVANKTFDKGSFVENKGQGIPGYAASYGLASLFGAMGLLGTAEIDGIPVHVHEDGSVTPVSPEDEPGFDSSKMNITSDKEAKDLPTKKQYRPTTPKATTQDMIEEIYGTSPTRGEKRLASLESSGLQDRFRGVYGRPFRTI